jgi:flagellar motor switch protein FliM
MGEILSSQEVEAVVSSSAVYPEQSTSSAGSQEVTAPVEAYDFGHPTPLRPAQMDALRIASTVTSRSVQDGLTRLLHTPVSVSFLAVEQSTIREYLAASEQPTCLATLRSTISTQIWLMEMSRTLAFAMIDCLLGGRPTLAGPVLTRPFTDLEVSLISKGVMTFLRDVSGELLQTNSLRISQLVSDGSLIAERESNEAVVTISFEVICGPCQGLVQLCIPWKDVSQTSALLQVAGTQAGERMRLAAAKVPVMVTARVARLKLQARDVADLSPGDLLVSETDATADVSLEVDHREFFRGIPAQSHGRKVFLVKSRVFRQSEESRPKEGLSEESGKL